MIPNWSALQYVTSGLGLLALIVAAIVAVLRARIVRDREALESVPSSERADLIRDVMGRRRIPTQKMSGSDAYAFLVKELEARSRMYRARVILIAFCGVLFTALSWISISCAAAAAQVAKAPCTPDLSRVLWSRIRALEHISLQYRNMTKYLGRVDTLVAMDSVTFSEFDSIYVFPYSETFAALLREQKTFRLSLEAIADDGIVRNAYDKLWLELWQKTHDALIFDTEGISLNHWMQDLYFSSHCKLPALECRSQQRDVMVRVRNWNRAMNERIPEIEIAMSGFINAVRLLCPLSPEPT